MSGGEKFKSPYRGWGGRSRIIQAFWNEWEWHTNVSYRSPSFNLQLKFYFNSKEINHSHSCQLRWHKGGKNSGKLVRDHVFVVATATSTGSLGGICAPLHALCILVRLLAGRWQEAAGDSACTFHRTTVGVSRDKDHSSWGSAVPNWELPLIILNMADTRWKEEFLCKTVFRTAT